MKRKYFHSPTFTESTNVIDEKIDKMLIALKEEYKRLNIWSNVKLLVYIVDNWQYSDEFQNRKNLLIKQQNDNQSKIKSEIDTPNLTIDNATKLVNSQIDKNNLDEDDISEEKKNNKTN